MRRLIGRVMMLAGAFGLYWAVQDAGGHMPANYSFSNPVVQYGAGGALLFIIGLAIFRSYRPPLKNTMECPGCGKTLQKGRRNCPFCKQELVKY